MLKGTFVSLKAFQCFFWEDSPFVLFLLTLCIKHLHYLLHLHHRLILFFPLNIWIDPSRGTLTTSLLPSCWNPSGLTAHKNKCQSELKFGWRWSGGVNTVPFAKLPTRTYAQTSRFCRFHRAIPGRLKISVAVGRASKRHQAGLWWQRHKTRWCLVKGVVSYISLLLHRPSTEPGGYHGNRLLGDSGARVGRLESVGLPLLKTRKD